MLKNLGALGIAGLVIVLLGIGLVAYANPLIAAGLVLVLAGLGLVVQSLVSRMLRQFGLF